MKEVTITAFPGIDFIGRQHDDGYIEVIAPGNARPCGSCTLCCTVMPVSEIGKKAHERCKHLGSAAKRCKVYATRPRSCEVWWCMWSVNHDMPASLRPDYSRVVVDLEPERLVKRDADTGLDENIPAIVVWTDPKYPDAYQAPDFLKALEGMCNKIGGPALIRIDSNNGFVLYPPKMLPDQPDRWVRVESTVNPNLAPRELLRR